MVSALKRLILPLYNRSCATARRAGLYADAAMQGRIERCTVCGRRAPMLYYRQVIAPRLEQLWGLSPDQAEALARKETNACGWCGANLRARRLSEVLIRTIPAGGASSVADWVRRTEARAFRIAEINRIEGLHEALERLPHLAFSDFAPGAPPGSIAGGVRSEDLTRLSYPDEAFDVILTSETLEHVPDLTAALREIRRVLVPGGWHLFTVPVLPRVARTFARASVRPDGTLDHHHPPIHHPGGDSGYLVFTEFGADLPDLLARAGFETQLHFGPVREDDLAQVFAAQKPPGREDARATR